MDFAKIQLAVRFASAPKILVRFELTSLTFIFFLYFLHHLLNVFVDIMLTYSSAKHFSVALTNCIFNFFQDPVACEKFSDECVREKVPPCDPDNCLDETYQCIKKKSMAFC